MPSRTLIAAVLAWLSLCGLGRADTTRVAVAPARGASLVITVDHTVTRATAHTTHVSIRIPRDLAVIPSAKFISFHSYTRYINGDESWLDNPPIGFLLFGSDSHGATLEIRLVELYDKHDYIASEINGIYSVKRP
jgi:hypothetical protein